MQKGLKMEANKNQLKSIWGKWWVPIRKWFYPAWLIYEASIRFYDYAIDLYKYTIGLQDYIGETSTQILAVFSGIITFVICSFYLTVPASLALFKFFKKEKPISHSFEDRIKTCL